jgi:hypothetical protein
VRNARETGGASGTGLESIANLSSSNWKTVCCTTPVSHTYEGVAAGLTIKVMAKVTTLIKVRLGTEEACRCTSYSRTRRGVAPGASAGQPEGEAETRVISGPRALVLMAMMKPTCAAHHPIPGNAGSAGRWQRVHCPDLRDEMSFMSGEVDR